MGNNNIANMMMGMMGNRGANITNNPMALLMQLMGGKMNPQSAVQMMVQQNPQMQQLWQQVQQMSQGKTPQEMEKMVRELCGQNGIDFDQAMSMLQQFNKGKK